MDAVYDSIDGNERKEPVKALLGFHAWYKTGGPFSRGELNSNFSIWDNSVRILLEILKSCLPRLDGNGWHLQKFHDIIHLVEGIRYFGNPMNFEASLGESGLKFWAKLHAATSQMQGAYMFTKQVASRSHESRCMEKMVKAMEKQGSLLPVVSPCKEW